MRAPVALSPSGCFFAVRRRSLMVIYLSLTKKHHLRLRKDSSLRLGGSLDEVHLQERLEVQVGHLVLVRDVVVPGNVLPVFVGS